LKRKIVTVLLKYSITALIGFSLVVSVLNLHGFEEAVDIQDKYRILSDAFTIPGVVLMLCGALVWIANEGAFEGISYAVSYSLRMLIPGVRKEHERYRDYVERRRENGPVKGYSFLVITGAAFFAVALVFVALFYSL
jgi:hypothetical protein